MKEKLLEIFGTVYGNPVNLLDWISECKELGISFDTETLIQNLEYVLNGESKYIQEGSAACLDGKEVRLHHIDPKPDDLEKFIYLYEKEDIILRFGAIHGDDLEIINRLGNRLVYITTHELKTFINSLKED